MLWDIGAMLGLNEACTYWRIANVNRLALAFAIAGRS